MESRDMKVVMTQIGDFMTVPIGPYLRPRVSGK